MATKVNMEFANFDARLSLANPVADYTKLIDDKMKADVIMPHDVHNECWKKISAAARETIWKLLFDEEMPSRIEQLEKAAILLKMHKDDAAFYQATDYNQWIVSVRDELLKRNMYDFWINVMVEKELGPCWARDSDLFDDTDDPEPANFYKYADCEAPWLKIKTDDKAEGTTEMVASALYNKQSPTDIKLLKKITLENPVADYRYNMDNHGDMPSGDDDEDVVFKLIFAETREIIWQLLFSEPELNAENFEKASELLEEYKRDSCFYSPWDYNEWIIKVKAEIFKRKYFDFWVNVVVRKELGLCWAADSDYFDDMDDPEPAEFYKVDEQLVKEYLSIS